MSITFYNMLGCGFCKKAKDMFADEIASGEIIEKPSSEAPPGVNGFPTFSANGKLHSGLPQSKQELYSKLGVSKLGVSKEKYMRGYGDPPNPWLLLYIRPIPAASLSSSTTKYVYIPLSKVGSPKGLSGFLIDIGSNYASEVYNKSQQPDGKQTQSIQDAGISKQITTITEAKVLMTIFPCVSSSDWNSIFVDGKIPTGFLQKLLPPQPCKNDNSVYCCAGNDGPTHKFFDIKTIIMICFILLLFSILLYVIMNSKSKSKFNASSSNM